MYELHKTWVLEGLLWSVRSNKAIKNLEKGPQRNILGTAQSLMHWCSVTWETGRLKCWVAVFTYENAIKREFVVQPPNTIPAAGINRIFTLLSRSKHSSMSFLLFSAQHLYKHVERILQSVQRGLSLFTVTDQKPSSKINNGQKKKKNKTLKTHVLPELRKC